jgi:hypothetical protein
VVLEKLESRGAGTYFVDYVGCVFWGLLVEGDRYESYDTFEVVESDGQERVWGIAATKSGLLQIQDYSFVQDAGQDHIS